MTVLTLRRKTTFPVLLVLAATFLMGCMPPTRAVSQEQSVKREVVNVLLSMQTAYEKRNIDEFMVWVSKKYRRRKRFRKAVLKDFTASRKIRLSLVIDQILVGEKGADITIHWYRTWVSYPENTVMKQEGKARLMFTLNPIRLLFQTGNRPFGRPVR